MRKPNKHTQKLTKFPKTAVNNQSAESPADITRQRIDIDRELAEVTLKDAGTFDFEEF